MIQSNSNISTFERIRIVGGVFRMSKRINLPYTTQDLFPQVGSTSPHQGSIISTHSSNFGEIQTDPSVVDKLKKMKRMFRRIFKPTTLDFETAIWEIFNLIINPKKMYKTHYYYKQQSTSGKSSYTRDDPSFLILLTVFLMISAIAWGLAYSPHFWDIVKLILYMVIIDFYLTGVVIATISWFITNKIFNNGVMGAKYSLNYIEWGFCFDIHCNSFLIIWCLLYILQFLLLPIIRIKNSLFALVLGNSLYFGSVGYYFIITLYGFNSLPFITNTGINNLNSNDTPARYLQMIIVAGILPLLLLGWIITLAFRFNVADTMVETYFN